MPENNKIPRYLPIISIIIFVIIIITLFIFTKNQHQQNTYVKPNLSLTYAIDLIPGPKDKYALDKKPNRSNEPSLASPVKDNPLPTINTQDFIIPENSNVEYFTENSSISVSSITYTSFQNDNVSNCVQNIDIYSSAGNSATTSQINLNQNINF